MEDLLRIVNHSHFTAVEYYLKNTLTRVLKSPTCVDNLQEETEEDDICCICQCNLFENINGYTYADFLSQLEESSENDPICMDYCESHFFHKACLKMAV